MVLIGLMFAGFISLGLPDGLLGAAGATALLGLVAAPWASAIGIPAIGPTIVAVAAAYLVVFVAASERHR